MVVYIKDDRGKLKSLSDLAIEYDLPIALLRSRWTQGKTTLEELTLPKRYYQHHQKTKSPHYVEE